MSDESLRERISHWDVRLLAEAVGLEVTGDEQERSCRTAT